tara:strand:- start:91 stop:501 length:411 start_codon:yes stop_codon:yes gene_type:complete
MDTSISLKDYPFHHQLNTRWKDLDAFRHINNAAYLTYIEDARIVLLRRWKIDYQQKSLIVASVKIDYIKQVNHPSSLVIGQKVSRIGTKSFDIESAVFNKETSELVCMSTITSVAFDFVENKTVKVFKEIIEDFKK